MHINPSSSIQYMRPIAPALSPQALKNIVTFLAIAILAGIAIYQIVVLFWRNKSVKEVSLEKSAASAIIPVPIDIPAMPPPIPAMFKADLLAEPLDISKLEKPAAVEVPHTSEDKKALPVPDQKKKEVTYDSGLTLEENIELQLEAVVKQEKEKHAYSGMFVRYDGVCAALKLNEKEGKQEPVLFCNQAFIDHYEKTKNYDSDWEICLSVEPAQRYLAWKILSDELENSPLGFQGLLRPDQNCPPCKEVVLQFLKADHDKEIELQHFLSRVANRLLENGVANDSRPIDDERMVAFETEALPYFHYRTNTFIIVEDSIWDVLLKGKSFDQVLTGKVVRIHGDSIFTIRKSFYQTLGLNRSNPLSLTNPFQGLKIYYEN